MTTSNATSTSSAVAPLSAPTVAPDLTAYETAAPVAGRSVGHTSVVFKLKLEGGLEAAFKPRSRRGRSRYKGEVAAYRLARRLGLSNVPPAIIRSFTLSALRAALGGETDAGALLVDEAVPDGRGNVTGALIPWIPKLEFLPLESDPWAARWKGWLAADGGVDDDGGLAPQVSTMIVFDYLTGNWDRWSGGQIGIDRTHGILVFMDNDGAFFDPPPPAPLAAQLARLLKVSRFSGTLVAVLRELDPNAISLAVGEESPGVPLLSPRVLAGVEERRKAALAAIDAKVAELGESAVLAFP